MEDEAEAHCPETIVGHKILLSVLGTFTLPKENLNRKNDFPVIFLYNVARH